MNDKGSKKTFADALTGFLRKRRTPLFALAAIVVFATTYILILPAMTLDEKTAGEQGGIDVPGQVQQTEVPDARKPDAENTDAEASDSDKSDAEKPADSEAADADKSDAEGDEAEAQSGKQSDRDKSEAEKEAAGSKDEKAEAAKTEDAKAGPASFEGKGFSITASGEGIEQLPADTDLTAEEITAKDKEYKAWYDEALKAIQEKDGKKKAGSIKFAKFYDITLTADGEAIEPEAPVDVTISYDKALKASDAQHLRIVHFGVDEEGEIVPEVLDSEDVDPTIKGGKMTETSFTAESFSVYGVVYTVDFSYEVDGRSYEYGMTGGSVITMSELLPALNVVKDDPDTKADEATEFLAGIESVTFSDESLISVHKVDADTTAGKMKEELGLKPEYSRDLTEDDIKKIDAAELKKGDWALFSLKAFDTEETLTIRMETGEVWTVKVTDNQASDPLGLNEESFVITNGNHDRSLKAQADSNAGSLQAQNPPSSDAINIWKFEYDEEAFDGAGGYYLVCVINGNNNYLRADGNNLSLAPVKPSEAEPGQRAATPFNITYDHGEMRYRISAAADGNSAFLTYEAGGWGQNGRFSLNNTKSDNNLLTFRDTNQPTSTPGTVGSWDIKSDGIVLKLFDYEGKVSYRTGSGAFWDPYVYHNNEDIDDAWGSNVSNQQLRDGAGINHDRSLLFSGSGLGNDEAFNNFTGDKNGGTYYSGYAYQDIVKYNLGTDRFPVLQSGNVKTNTDRQTGGSLAYLFNDSAISNAKKVYAGENNSGLEGLLRKDHEGYYYYDSEENFAKLVGNEVILYSDTYRKNTSSSTDVKTTKIGLFPFDDYQSNEGEEKGPSGSVYHHQFGMSIATDFIYPKDGIVPETNKPMTFEFSGDDDVWVFVDGVLVLDLGGVHQPISGKIDFKSGNVTITEFGSNGVEYTSSKSTTIDDMFTKASQEAGRTITFDRSEFSTHKLEFFYLERGGCDSNCKIKFNLLMMKTLTFAKKLNGLTPTERQKYLNDEFLYELGIKHDHNGIDLHNNEDEYWEDTSWRDGFSTYNTADPNQTSQENHTVKTLKDGTEVTGVPVKDGQIRLKDGEKMTITHLPKTDIFYLAEEDQLDMDQFETPHAERLYTDSSSMSRHEEEVHLHESHVLNGGTSDWETRPYALADTENLVYTNTLQEKNLDVKKIWSDGAAKHTGDTIKFKLNAKVMDGTEGGKDYAAFMTEYNQTNGTNYSTNINAQWTQTVSGTATTTTENVLNKEFELKTANNWNISFEHLPKKTQAPNDTGKEIVYEVEEVVNSVPAGYTSTVGTETDANKVYLDLFKFWPDENANHDGSSDEKKLEHIYTRVKTSDGQYIKATKKSNGEYEFVGFTNDKNEGTRFLLTSKTQLQNLQTADQTEMFDYAARVNNVPEKNGTGQDAVAYDYQLEQDGDEDDATTGLVMFNRPVKEVKILNEKHKGRLQIEKKVTYNNDTPSASELPELEGEYKFKIFEDQACTIPYKENGKDKIISITIENTATKASEIIELPIGEYWIKEISEKEGLLPNENPIPVTVTEASLTGKQVIAECTNNKNVDSGPDALAIELEKTFEGLASKDEIPSGFNIQFSYRVGSGLNSKREITLRNADEGNIGQDKVNIDWSDNSEDGDGLTWHWRITNIPVDATDFKVAEDNYTKAGYTVTTTLNGETVQDPSQPSTQEVLKPTVSFEQVEENEINPDNNKVFGFNEDMIWLVRATGNEGVIVASVNTLSYAAREAVKQYIKTNTFPQASWSNLPVNFYSREAHPDGFAVHGDKIKIEKLDKPINGYEYQLIIGKNQSNHNYYYQMVYLNNSTENSFKYVNTYENIPTGFDIIKVDKESRSTKLPGAVFTLTQLDETTTPANIVYKKNDQNELVKQMDSEPTGEDGKASFDGLTNGYYEIKEKTPPDGYILTDDATFYIKLKDGQVSYLKVHTDSTKPVTEWEPKSSGSGDLIQYTPATSDSEASFEIGNTPGAALPNSGGPGTTLFYVLGMILTLGAATLLVARRRIRVQQ